VKRVLGFSMHSLSFLSLEEERWHGRFWLALKDNKVFCRARDGMLAFFGRIVLIVFSLSNRGGSVPPGCVWTRKVFDCFVFEKKRFCGGSISFGLLSDENKFQMREGKRFADSARFECERLQS